jgi:peptidoglycan/xylan/chitin deacetylase (PgdA/CDA1 family)
MVHVPGAGQCALLHLEKAGNHRWEMDGSCLSAYIRTAANSEYIAPKSRGESPLNAEVFKRRVACEILSRSRLCNLASPLFSGIGSILNFHCVLPKTSRPRLKAAAAFEVTPEWLEQSILYYRAKNVEIVSLDTMHEILKGTEPRRRFVVYTFDDGYEDNFNHAYPVFKKHNAPFTVNVAIGFPDRKIIPWRYPLEELIVNHPIFQVRLNGKTVTFDCTTESDRETTYYKLRSAILGGFRGDYVEVQKSIFQSHGIDIHKYSGLGMGWDQLRTLAGDPLVTIGSHGIQHVRLSKLSLGEMTREVVQSKEILESQLRRKIEHFAFPYWTKDDAGEREFRVVSSAGYKTGVTTRAANIFPQHRAFTSSLPRNMISGEREGLNLKFLDLWLTGMIPALKNRFRRVVTV